MNQNTSFSRRLRGLFTITDYQPAALAKRLGVVCQAEGAGTILRPAPVFTDVSNILRLRSFGTLCPRGCCA